MKTTCCIWIFHPAEPGAGRASARKASRKRCGPSLITARARWVPAVKKWIERPLVDKKKFCSARDRIEYLMKNYLVREDLEGQAGIRSRYGTADRQGSLTAPPMRSTASAYRNPKSGAGDSGAVSGRAGLSGISECGLLLVADGAVGRGVCRQPAGIRQGRRNVCGKASANSSTNTAALRRTGRPGFSSRKTMNANAPASRR